MISSARTFIVLKPPRPPISDTPPSVPAFVLYSSSATHPQNKKGHGKQMLMRSLALCLGENMPSFQLQTYRVAKCTPLADQIPPRTSKPLTRPPVRTARSERVHEDVDGASLMSPSSRDPWLFGPTPALFTPVTPSKSSNCQGRGSRRPNPCTVTSQRVLQAYAGGRDSCSLPRRRAPFKPAGEISGRNGRSSSTNVSPASGEL